jgi:TrmH family RNA methyltransferase
VVLLEPQTEGNIGAIARTMKNFGFKDLILINPCKLGDTAYKRAMHANDVLDKAKTYPTFEDALKHLDFIVGTSGIVNVNDKRHLRNPIPPDEFAERIFEINGKIGLVFGREDQGLSRDELFKCDMLITIPASKNYPIMNISHACTIILYELYNFKHELKEPRPTNQMEKEKMYQQFHEFLVSMNYPKHKLQGTEVLFRRLMGRSLPSKWEFHTMMGVFSRATKWIKRGNNK